MNGAPVIPYHWQQGLWAPLCQQFEAQRLPHALMLTGQRGVGKHQFAKVLAQKLLCQSPTGDYGCGQCKGCQLLQAETHPDLRWLSPEEKSRVIKIDDVRTMCDFLAKTAQQGGWKVAVIEPAEAMNVHAANALLKSLEEPSGRTILVLLSHDAHLVPATVRSRCRKLLFPTPSRDEVIPWLEQVSGKPVTDIIELLHGANGSPLLALEMDQNNGLEKHRQFVQLLLEVASGQRSAITAAEECLSLSPLEALGWLQSSLIKALPQVQLSGEGSELFHNPPNIHNVYRYLDRLAAARRQMQSTANLNVQLLWEQILLDWKLLNAGS